MPKRFHFIDALKALGILMFIIWHVFENFYAHRPITSGVFRSVVGVTGYFVFSSGFLIGFHYYQNDAFIGKWLWNRLGIRAGKLIFIVLITGILLILLENRQFTADLLLPFLNICSLFYTDRWDIPLQVLIAIGSTLAIGLVSLRYRQVNFFVLANWFIFGLFLSWELFSDSRLPYLWRYVFHGYIGIFIGIFFFNRILSREMQTQFSERLIMGFSLIVFCFMEILVVIDEKMYLQILYNTILQATMVTSFFIGFSLMFKTILDENKCACVLAAVRPFLLLGKHSLFVYLLQIIIINLVLIVYPVTLLSPEQCIMASLLLFITCLFITIGLEWLLKVQWVKSIYGVVFR